MSVYPKYSCLGLSAIPLLLSPQTTSWTPGSPGPAVHQHTYKTRATQNTHYANISTCINKHSSTCMHKHHDTNRNSLSCTHTQSCKHTDGHRIDLKSPVTPMTCELKLEDRYLVALAWFGFYHWVHKRTFSDWLSLYKSISRLSTISRIFWKMVNKRHLWSLSCTGAWAVLLKVLRDAVCLLLLLCPPFTLVWDMRL